MRAHVNKIYAKKKLHFAYIFIIVYKNTCGSARCQFASAPARNMFVKAYMRINLIIFISAGKLI